VHSNTATDASPRSTRQLRRCVHHVVHNTRLNLAGQGVCRWIRAPSYFLSLVNLPL